MMEDLWLYEIKLIRAVQKTLQTLRRVFGIVLYDLLILSTQS